MLLGFSFFLGLGEVGMRLLYPQWSEFYSGRFIGRELVPGHSPTAIGKRNFNGHFAQNNGDFRVSIKINDFGLRNGEPVMAADGRIWIVGDSMAFGWGVEQSEMYSSIIKDLSGTPTYNVASPGTDICGYQSLIARMPKSVQPSGVILGLILENDIRVYDCRSEVARISTEPTGPLSANINLSQLKSWLVKNSALYNAVTVSLKRVPAVLGVLKDLSLVKPEHVYKLTFDGAKVGQLAESVAQEISRTRAMLPSNIPFSVLLAPARFEIRDGDHLYRSLRLETAAALAAKGIDVIDPFPDFRNAGFAPTHFAHDGHWSPLGHKIAGENAANWLAGVFHQR